MGSSNALSHSDFFSPPARCSVSSLCFPWYSWGVSFPTLSLGQRGIYFLVLSMGQMMRLGFIFVK